MTTPTVLFGLRCADPTHPGRGQKVYLQGPGRHRVESLAAGVACYEIVTSTDGGATWSRADA
jgi:hypothetical protein